MHPIAGKNRHFKQMSNVMHYRIILSYFPYVQAALWCHACQPDLLLLRRPMMNGYLPFTSILPVLHTMDETPRFPPPLTNSPSHSLTQKGKKGMIRREIVWRRGRSYATKWDGMMLVGYIKHNPP